MPCNLPCPGNSCQLKSCLLHNVHVQVAPLEVLPVQLPPPLLWPLPPAFASPADSRFCDVQVLHLRQEAGGAGVVREDHLGGWPEQDHQLVHGEWLQRALGR